MRVVVVGGGVIALATAYRLAKAGCEVVVVEAGEVGTGASHGNAARISLGENGPVPGPGVLVQGLKWMLKPDSPLYVKPSANPSFLRFMAGMARACSADFYRFSLRTHLRLAENANDLLDEWAQDGVDFEQHTDGVLLAYEHKESFDAHAASMAMHAEFGFEGERLDAAAVHEFEPELSNRIRYGLRYTTDRQIEPDSLIRGLVKRCTELGVRIHEHDGVVRFLTSGNRVTGVITAAGAQHSGDAVVLAAGVHTGELSAKLGLGLPIRPGKGYSLDYRPAPLALRTALTLEDARVAVTPLNGMIRLAGTMEFGGLELSVNPVRVEAIRRAAAEAFPSWGTPAGEAAPWAGLRPMTPDGLPVIGRLGPLVNAYIGSGHGMLGLTFAPITGDLLTEMITEHRTPDVAAALSPDRFLSRRALLSG
jgi:D-amino-acid dehydrogenase